jgi:hypothetical protein
MEPLKILQLLAQQGGQPSFPHTPIPPEGLPPIDPPAPPAPAKPKEDDANLSEFEKLMKRMQDEQATPRAKATGGAATLNPFYNPNSPGMGTETFTKMATAMGGK